MHQLFHGPLRARLAVTLPLLAPGALDPTLLSSLVKEIYAVDPGTPSHAHIDVVRS